MCSFNFSPSFSIYSICIWYNRIIFTAWSHLCNHSVCLCSFVSLPLRGKKTHALFRGMCGIGGFQWVRAIMKNDGWSNIWRYWTLMGLLSWGHAQELLLPLGTAAWLESQVKQCCCCTVGRILPLWKPFFWTSASFNWTVLTLGTTVRGRYTR